MNTVAIAVTKVLIGETSGTLTAVAWQLLPKSKIWTTAQYLKLKNE